MQAAAQTKQYGLLEKPLLELIENLEDFPLGQEDENHLLAVLKNKEIDFFSRLELGSVILKHCLMIRKAEVCRDLVSFLYGSVSKIKHRHLRQLLLVVSRAAPAAAQEAFWKAYVHLLRQKLMWYEQEELEWRN